MADAKTRMEEYAKEYMGKVFYFCLRRLGNTADAEELSSDIGLAVFSALRRGTEPDNFAAWVWQIARNRYARWIDAKQKKRERFHTTDIADLALADEYCMEEEIVHREDLSLLRRELAFIAQEYREIVVAFYMDDKSVRAIAASLHLPEGTVKSRLFRARAILKEGMYMAREFGKRAYAPEDVQFAQNAENGTDGRHLVERLVSKNLLLEAYDNPCTAEELALALGISLPYVEDELAPLLHNGLMVQKGERYSTNIAILSREAQIATLAPTQTAAREIADAMETALAEITRKRLPANQSAQEQKLALAELYLENAERFFPVLYKDDVPICYIFTIAHPDGSRWAIVGYETRETPSPRFLECYGTERIHQIIVIGGRTGNAETQVDIAQIPCYSRSALPSLLQTSEDARIAQLLMAYHAEIRAILRADLPSCLRDSAMYMTNYDIRLFILEELIARGVIVLPPDMNKSTVGMWNYRA